MINAMEPLPLLGGLVVYITCYIKYSCLLLQEVRRGEYWGLGVYIYIYRYIYI